MIAACSTAAVVQQQQHQQVQQRRSQNSSYTNLQQMAQMRQQHQRLFQIQSQQKKEQQQQQQQQQQKPQQQQQQQKQQQQGYLPTSRRQSYPFAPSTRSLPTNSVTNPLPLPPKLIQSAAVKSPPLPPRREHNASVNSPQLPSKEEHKAAVNSPQLLTNEEHKAAANSPQLLSRRVYNIAVNSSQLPLKRENNVAFNSPQLPLREVHKAAVNSPQLPLREEHKAAVNSPQLPSKEEHKAAVYSPQLPTKEEHKAAANSPQLLSRRVYNIDVNSSQLPLKRENNVALNSPQLPLREEHKAVVNSPQLPLKRENNASDKSSQLPLREVHNAAVDSPQLPLRREHMAHVNSSQLQSRDRQNAAVNFPLLPHKVPQNSSIKSLSPSSMVAQNSAVNPVRLPSRVTQNSAFKLSSLSSKVSQDSHYNPVPRPTPASFISSSRSRSVSHLQPTPRSEQSPSAFDGRRNLPHFRSTSSTSETSSNTSSKLYTSLRTRKSVSSSISREDSLCSNSQKAKCNVSQKKCDISSKKIAIAGPKLKKDNSTFLVNLFRPKRNRRKEEANNSSKTVHVGVLPRNVSNKLNPVTSSLKSDTDTATDDVFPKYSKLNNSYITAVSSSQNCNNDYVEHFICRSSVSDVKQNSDNTEESTVHQQDEYLCSKQDRSCQTDPPCKVAAVTKTDTLKKKGKTVVPPVPLPRRTRNVPRVVHSILKPGKSDVKIHNKSSLQSVPDGILHFDFKPSDEDSKHAPVCSDRTNFLLPKTCTDIKCTCPRQSDTMPLLKMAIGYSFEGSHESSDKVVVLASCINQYMEAVFSQIDSDNTGYVSKREFDALAKFISIPRRQSWGASKGKISFSEFQSRLWDCWFQNNMPNMAAVNNRRPNPSLLESILNCTRSLKSLEDLSKSLNNFNKVVQNNVNLFNESSNEADNSQSCPFTEDSAEILDLKRNYFVHCEENKRLRRAIEDLRQGLQSSDAENLALRVKMQVREEIRAEISQNFNNGNKGKHFQHCYCCIASCGENKSESHKRTKIIRSLSEPRLATATDIKSYVSKLIRSAPTSPQWKRRQNCNDELWADFQRGLDSSFETSSVAEPTELNLAELEQPSKTDNICITNGKPQFEIPKFKSQDSNPASLQNAKSKITSFEVINFGLPLVVTPTSTISQYENTRVTSDLSSSRRSHMNDAYSSTSVDLNDTYVSMCSMPQQISVEEHIYNEIKDNLPKFSKKENPLPLKSAVSVPCMSSMPKPKIEFVRSRNSIDVKVAHSRPVEKELKSFCINDSPSVLYANTTARTVENPCYENIANYTERSDATEIYTTMQPKIKYLQANKNVEQERNALYQNVNAEGYSKVRSLSLLCQTQISNSVPGKCTGATHISGRSLMDLSHVGNRKESITSPINAPIRLCPTSAMNVSWTFNNPTYDYTAFENSSGLVKPEKFVSPTQQCDGKDLAKTPRISPSIQREASPKCTRSGDLAGLLATRDLLLATLQAVTAGDRNSSSSSSTTTTNDNIDNTASSTGITTTHKTTHRTAQQSQQQAELHLQPEDACTRKTAEQKPISGHNAFKQHRHTPLTRCVDDEIRTEDLQRGEAEGSESQNVAEEEAKETEKQGLKPAEDKALEIIINRKVEGQEEKNHGNNKTKISSAEAIFDEFLEYCRHYDIPLDEERHFKGDEKISDYNTAEETTVLRKHDPYIVSSGMNLCNKISVTPDSTLTAVLLPKCPWCSPSMDPGEFCLHVPPFDDDCSSAEGAGSDSGKGDSLGSSPSPERLSQTSSDGSEDMSWEPAECPLEEPLSLPCDSSTYCRPPSFEEGETKALVSLLVDYDHVEETAAQGTIIVEALQTRKNSKVDNLIQVIGDINQNIDVNRDTLKSNQFEKIKSYLIDGNDKAKEVNSNADNLKVKNFFGRRSRSFNTFRNILASTTSHFIRNSKSRSSISSCNPSFTSSNLNYTDKTEQNLAPCEIKSIFKNNQSKKPVGSKIKRHISFSDKVDVYDASDAIITYDEDLEDEYFCQDAGFVLEEEGSCLQEEQTQDVYSESATRELENIFDEAVAYLAENDEIEDACSFKNQSYLWCTESNTQFDMTAAATESFYDINTSNGERNLFSITEHLTTLPGVENVKLTEEYSKQVINFRETDDANNSKRTTPSNENVVQVSSNRDLLDALDEELQMVLQQLEEEDNWILQGK